jgi:hypothetical protein
LEHKGKDQVYTDKKPDPLSLFFWKKKIRPEQKKQKKLGLGKKKKKSHQNVKRKDFDGINISFSLLSKMSVEQTWKKNNF